MQDNFKALVLQYYNSRADVAKAFNKSPNSLNHYSMMYKAKGGRKGLLSSNQQVPYAVFVSRVIRNTPREFWEFFLDDDNFKQFDIVKTKRERKKQGGC